MLFKQKIAQLKIAADAEPSEYESREDARKRLILSGLLLLSLLMLLLSLVYAWFINNGNSSADSIGFDSALAIDSLISVDGIEYAENVEFEEGAIVLREVSGLGFIKTAENGKRLALYNPKKDAFTGEPLPVSDEDDSWDMEEDGITENVHYVQRDVLFKTNVSGNVYLESADILPLDPTGVSRLSDFGNFTADYIAGAVRVSFSEVVIEDEEEVEYPRLVYAPNKNYEFSYSNGVYSFNENGTPESGYYYYDGSVQADVLTDEETGDTYVMFEGGKVPFWTDIKKVGEGAVSLLTLKESESGYEGTIRIRIWVEGTDRESVSQLSGGKFSRSFVFKAVH